MMRKFTYIEVKIFFAGKGFELLEKEYVGNPRRYNKNDLNAFGKKTFGQLYNETVERIKILTTDGFVVKFVWECDYRSGNMFSEEL